MHLAGHIVISILFSFLALGDSSVAMYVAFLSGAILIDLDHVLYAAIAKRTLSPKKISDYLYEENKTHTPHIYIFHTVEMLFALYVIGVFFVTDLQISAFIAAFAYGMELHLIIDFLSYVWLKRTFRGWLKYFSLSGILLSRA